MSENQYNHRLFSFGEKSFKCDEENPPAQKFFEIGRENSENDTLFQFLLILEKYCLKRKDEIFKDVCPSAMFVDTSEVGFVLIANSSSYGKPEKMMIWLKDY
jgi:hypothetical protein